MKLNNPDLIKLKKLVGLGAFRVLRNGAILHCWRRSTPYNWWIEDKKKNTLWHSSDGERPSLSMFEVLNHSTHKIDYSPIHSSGGKSEESEYVLKPELRYSHE